MPIIRQSIGCSQCYTILIVACSASGSSPFHKRAERKWRVLDCKPNQTHVLIHPSCLHPSFCSYVLMS